MSSALIVVILLSLFFQFLNGVRDSSNIVATMISSRTFRPRTALTLTAISEFLGPLLFGVTVAKTIGDDIVDSHALNLDVVIGCLVGAIIWNLITWYFGMPGSSSHALIGGLVGAVLISTGTGTIKFAGLNKVLVALFVSPIFGFVIGFIILRFIYFLVRRASPNVNEVFKRGQIFTAVALAFSHGTNDAQKIMGIITLSLVITGSIDKFAVPMWVILVCAGTISLGTAMGGWRLIRTLGGKFYKIRPVHSFATQLASGFVILSASAVGLPVSTSQVVSSAIIGIGASERFGKVRWGVVGDILTSWLITIPASGLLSAGVYWLLINIR